MTPKALILTGYGINCDIETEFAFRIAGADAHRIHINEIINKKFKLEDFHILALPGGFSFGDDIASGKVLANMMKYSLGNEIQKFIDDKKLIIGICNGFQVMVKMGLLPAIDGNYTTQTTTLTYNDSGKFIDKWVYLDVNKNSKCVFTKNIDSLYLPIRHGEGKFVVKDDSILERMKSDNHIVLKYKDNPNGSIDDIAGICDSNGRVFGMMPHPEAYLHKTNHPCWTKAKLSEQGEGVAIFRNAVEYIRSH